MSNGGDALERVLPACPVEVLGKELDFPYTRSGRKAPQQDMKTGKFEAGSLLKLSNLISVLAFLKQQQCFISVPCSMRFMIETHHRSIT